MKITKAIIAVAGYGTRWLPYTKAIEKCMVPIGNRPLIDYLVDDCVKAGIEEILFVVNPHHEQLKSYYSKRPELSEYLIHKNKPELAALVDVLPQVKFQYLVQEVSEKSYGTAIPVWLSKDFINEDESFAYLTGDDFIYNRDGSSELSRAIEYLSQSDATALTMASLVADEQVPALGIFRYEELGGKKIFREIVEKPTLENKPSNLANISKYIFPYEIFPFVEQVINSTPTNQQGEYYIIDALNLFSASGRDVLVHEVTGSFQDGGNPKSWLKSVNQIYNDN